MAYARRISFEPLPLQVHVAGLTILFLIGGVFGNYYIVLSQRPVQKIQDNRKR